MPNQTSLPYRVVDVFTSEPLQGNALAVFTGGQRLGDRTMQRIARELNLSETVFVYPATRPDCAASLRIFTPFHELPFAGHPTVGASFVLLEEGIVPADSERFVLEEKIGPVPIRVERGEKPLIWLTTPPVKDGFVADRQVSAEALGLDLADIADAAPQLLTAGNPTLFIALRNREAVDRASLGMEGMARLKAGRESLFCVFVFTPTDAGAYSRMFAPEYGITEDPATGSATGPLAVYMIRHGMIDASDGTRFVSEQGTKMGRKSILHVHLRGAGGRDGIEVGGYVVPLVRAVMTLGASEI